MHQLGEDNSHWKPFGAGTILCNMSEKERVHKLRLATCFLIVGTKFLIDRNLPVTLRKLTTTFPRVGNIYFTHFEPLDF